MRRWLRRLWKRLDSKALGSGDGRPVDPSMGKSPRRTSPPHDLTVFINRWRFVWNYYFCLFCSGALLSPLLLWLILRY